MGVEKGYWITYHWAHPDPDDHPWHIYRKELTKLDREIEVGDEVLFFRGLRPFDASGRKRLSYAVRVKYRRRELRPLADDPAGIVRAGRVTDLPRAIRDSDIKYDYFNVDPAEGDSANIQGWKYITECGTT